jgi:hypothetical protein
MQEIAQERLGHVSDLARRRRHQACPLLGERRTFLIRLFMSANDPKRTSRYFDTSMDSKAPLEKEYRGAVAATLMA